MQNCFNRKNYKFQPVGALDAWSMSAECFLIRKRLITPFSTALVWYEVKSVKIKKGKVVVGFILICKLRNCFHTLPINIKYTTSLVTRLAMRFIKFDFNSSAVWIFD